MLKCLNDKEGFTLIEGLIGIAIFSIVFLALISVFSVAFNTIKNNRAKVIANSIALEELEIIRGMEFDNVATDTGWSPAGPIPSERNNVKRGGFNFTIQVDISFFDDPFDGTDESSPEDLFPYDYKKARVRVLWINSVTGEQEEVAMTTNIIPPGLEGGTGLLIVAADAYGAAIPNAKVDIASVEAGYTLNDALTDLNGNLWVGGLEPAGDYHISVTKDGYSVDQTYPIDNSNPKNPLLNPDYNPEPINPDAVVINGEVTRIVFSIDLLGSLKITTVNYDNPQNWRVNTDGGTDDQTNVDLAIDSSDNLYFVWVNDTGSIERIYAQKYDLSRNVQWLAGDVQLTASNNQVNPRIAIAPPVAPATDEEFFYLIWNDDRNGNQNTYLEKFRTSDGSSVWGDIKVNVDDNSADQINPDLAVDSAGNIYAVWMDNRNGNWDIYAQKYDLNGVPLWGVEDSDLKINADVGFDDQKNPRIATDNENNFYVVWEDEINGDQDIFLAKFGGDGGILFPGKKVNNDGSLLDQYDPAIVYDGANHFYLCWSDERNSEPDIYAQKYDKAGARVWLSGDIIVNDDSTSDAWRTKPSLAYFNDGIGGETIYFSWQDNRNENFDVYSAKFNSSGVKLWEYDLIMNGDSSDYPQENPEIAIDSTGCAVTAWEDFRSGSNDDIYATRYSDFSVFPRSNVPVTVRGDKLKGEYPESCVEGGCSPIYKYNKDFISDASGVINIGDGTSELEWDDKDGYSFSVGGGYTIVSTDQSIPLPIAPGESREIIINVEP